MADKKLLVQYGDSIGCPYRMKLRVNTYCNLLSRRFSMDCAPDYTTGATSTLVLQLLSVDEEKIADLKNADIVELSVGGNNVLVPFLTGISTALDLGPLGARTMIEIKKKFKSDPLAGPKVIKGLLGKETKNASLAGVETFRKEFPEILNTIKKLNPTAKVIVQTVYNPFNTVPQKIYKEMGKTIGKYMDMLNDIIKENQAAYGYVLADVEIAFKNYKGDGDLTYIKEKDMHLTDFGHLFIYNLIYDEFVKMYPEYACEEAPGVVKTLEDLTDEELASQKIEDNKTAAKTGFGEGDGKNVAVQPENFSDGPFAEYNSWFTSEAMGMKFYPLKKIEVNITNPTVAAALNQQDSMIFKLNGENIDICNTAGECVGTVDEGEVEESRVSIKFALENNFSNFAKVLETGEKLVVLYAVYPSYEYYEKQVTVTK